jgi:trk/ktr system potassium uptake protein
MRVVIVGCGRVGAIVAELLDAAGHEVVILDIRTSAFDRLTPSFGGNAIRGDGTDEDVLRRAGTDGADVFLALTEGDNRNIMAGQLAAEVFSVDKVVAKINDPVRAEAYGSMGIATMCRTNMMADAVYEFIGLPKLHLPGIQLPSGHHPGGEHHAPLQGSTTGLAGGASAVPAGAAAGAPGGAVAPAGLHAAGAPGAPGVPGAPGASGAEAVPDASRGTTGQEA